MADKIINVRIQQRYDTEANWKAKDPVLLKGEIVYTSDGTNIGKYKVGNGTSKWSALPYAKADLSKGDVTTALGYTPPTSNTWRGIQNNLTSDSTSDSLSAAQGKVLKGLVDGKAPTSHNHTIAQITNLQTTLDGKANTHSHPYLPTAGGTMNGTAYISWADSGNFGIANKDVTFPVSRGGLSWVGQSDAIYLHAVETGSDNLELYLKFTDDNSNGLSIRNASDKQTARISAGGTISATSFIGPLSGNASTATALTSSAGSTTQPIYFSGGKPVACTYTLGKSVPSNAVFTDTNTWRGIQNNLTSDSTSDSLSAAQGKVLKTLVDGKSASNHNHDSVYSKLGHTHSYLPLSGGDMTGTISSSLVTNTHIAGNKGTAIINSTASGTGYTMLAKMNSKNGVWAFGSWNSEFDLFYTSKDIIAAGKNSYTKYVKLLDESGNSSFPGTVSASAFSGPLSGNASSASSVPWSGVSGKPSSYPPSSHTHSYLPLSGGSLSGSFHSKPTASGSYNENIRIHPSPSNWTSIVMCGDDNTGDSGTSAKTWGIFTHNGVFGISKNGNGDSTLGAASLKCDANNIWYANGNTILHSANYNSYAPTKTGGGASGTWSISVSGNAATATKLATARSITLGGLSSGSANFDGSGNIIINDWGYGCKKYITQGNMKTPYFRIAYTETASSYDDRSVLFVIDSGAIGGGFGIVRVILRSDSIANANGSYCEVKWLVRNGFSANQLFIKGYAPANGTQYADLYFKASGTYNGIAVTVLSSGGRGDKSRKWTFEEGAARANPDIRTYSYTKEGVDAGTTNYSNSAGVASKLNNITADWSGQISSTSWFTAFSPSVDGQLRAISPANVKTVLGINNVNNTADADKSVKYATTAGSVAWGNVSGKPSTYTPSSHTHTKSQITDFPTSLPASDVYSWAKASSKPSYSWSEITGKPGTFTPSSDSNYYVRVYNSKNVNNNSSLTFNDLAKQHAAVGMIYAATDNPYGAAKWVHAISLAWSNNTNTSWVSQIGLGVNDGTGMWYRTKQGTIVGAGWTRVLDSSNYTSYTVTKSGSGASGTWGINVTGSAGSVAWGNVSGKPSSFTPSSHTHNYAGSSSAGGAANSSYKLSNVGQITTVDALNNFNEASIFKYATMAALDGLDGLSKNDGIILSAPWSSVNYGHQIFLDDNGYTIAHRYRNNGTWSSWKTLIDSSNIGSQSVNYASSASSVPWSGVTGKPTSLPASDVYSWAKASTKPSYSWDEIGNKPSYLLSNQIKRGANGGAWISARDNALVIGSGSSKDGWNPVVAQKTANGSWSIGNLNGNEHLSFSYTTDTDYNNGKNVATTINLPPTSGTLCLTNHTHPYLPTTGGTLNNGSTQCPLIITGAANNESSITYKYKGQNSGGHWVVGQGAGTANIDTFAFYKNGAGTLATLMADGQFRFNKLTLSGYQPKEYSAVGGIGAIANDYTIRFRGGTDGYFITKGPSSLNFGWDTDTSVVGDGSGSWGYTFRMQMKYCYCDVGFRSSGIYNSTISGSSNLNISSDGTIKRVSSAAKYKLDIQNINKPDTYAYNLLNLNPKQWFDKGETERYAKYLTAQYSGEKLRDEEESELLDGSINPYYGLIAEDVKAAGLDEFCIYGKADENGKKELEGIQYDRLPILTIPILRDLVTCMQKILPSVEKNISDPTLLSEVKEIESRFNSFNPQNIVNKQYAN